MKKQYDQWAEACQFCPGDRVLALLPIVDSPFQAKYSGPFSVARQVSDLIYLIATPGRRRATKTLEHLDVLVGHLDVAKCEQLSNLIYSHLSLFSDAPSQTHLIEHDIDIGDAKPIKQRFYHVSEEKRR